MPLKTPDYENVVHLWDIKETELRLEESLFECVSSVALKLNEVAWNKCIYSGDSKVNLSERSYYSVGQSEP